VCHTKLGLVQTGHHPVLGEDAQSVHSVLSSGLTLRVSCLLRATSAMVSAYFLKLALCKAPVLNQWRGLERQICGAKNSHIYLKVQVAQYLWEQLHTTPFYLRCSQQQMRMKTASLCNSAPGTARFWCYSPKHHSLPLSSAEARGAANLVHQRLKFFLEG